ncbi:serine/threonine-protein kinase [Candidatus Uabimicrobium amorphum]|uniref:non-specific serine/threonine protein kinase n=1 Tax=Uabimicrobium amorphum TaxID=2596890 RepID=A0A5S9IVV4_UABAM|nr:serine/threonine-protein kinase [Candidatus Uabimicrobium amorphum]BBM88040.1 protein kinase [Candidatus Uabimicrobium amorphum]
MSDVSNRVDALLRQCAKLLPDEDSANDLDNQQTMSEKSGNDLTATVGQQRFEFQGKIGQGGMGVVYKAYDKILSRVVAIKQIKLPSAIALKRFQREARNNASLHHPNIVAVHDFQTINNSPCIIMQYIEGISLAAYLKSKKLHIKETQHIFMQILDAIEYAHSKEIVHRDLKPSNILIDENDNVFITDFGIAKALNEGNSNLSITGEVLGTPMYMSPEQALGQAVDQRTDIYSLGTILYEMLAGRPVFTGKNPFTILQKVIKQTPSPIEDMSPVWNNFCKKALHKDRNMRFASVTEMKRSLQSRQKTPVFIRYASVLAVAIVVFFVAVAYGKNRQEEVPASMAQNEKPQSNENSKEENKDRKGKEKDKNQDAAPPQQVITQNFIMEYDQNQDQKIGLNEWPFKKDSFRSIDRNNDKLLTKNELSKKFKNIFNYMGKRREAHVWMQRMRKQKMMRKVPPFHQLDKNSDGKLSKAEFNKPLFWKIDSDKDSYISKREYRMFVRRAIKNK